MNTGRPDRRRAEREIKEWHEGTNGGMRGGEEGWKGVREEDNTSETSAHSGAFLYFFAFFFFAASEVGGGPERPPAHADWATPALNL